MLSENMMGSIFRITETAPHTPTSIQTVHVLLRFGSPRKPRPSLGGSSITLKHTTLRLFLASYQPVAEIST